MDYDDEICVCYHVTLRKLVHFARRVRPRQPAQMAECLGAGTGCGWCIPVLSKIAQQAGDPGAAPLAMTPAEYVAARAAYRDEKRPRNRFDAAEIERLATDDVPPAAPLPPPEIS